MEDITKKSNKNKKSFVWVIAPTAVAFLVVILFGIIGTIFNLPLDNISGITAILGAFFVGWAYAHKFGEIMPKDMRIRATALYTAINIFLAVYIIRFAPEIIPELEEMQIEFMPILTIITIIGLIYALIFYWVLGSGGKTGLKIDKKYKEKNNTSKE